VIRLSNVRSGHAFLGKLKLAVAPLVFGLTPPDIMRVLFYRPKFFGKPMGHLHQDVLRGPSDWTVAERELFAAYVSAKNRCRFCKQAHTAVADRALGRSVVDEVLAGGTPKEVSAKALAMLPFLEKLTITPEAMRAEDLEPLRGANIADAAIADAVYVCMLFCAMNRMVDAIGCELMGVDQLDKVARMLLEKGYEL